MRICEQSNARLTTEIVQCVGDYLVSAARGNAITVLRLLYVRARETHRRLWNTCFRLYKVCNLMVMLCIYQLTLRILF